MKRQLENFSVSRKGEGRGENVYKARIASKTSAIFGSRLALRGTMNEQAIIVNNIQGSERKVCNCYN